MSRASGAGVLNTWGAKGVERWDSPWHHGTVGLQQRDLELAGLAGADIVVTSGLDPDELPESLLARSVVQDVHPRQLSVLCRNWSGATGPARDALERPALHGALAEVVSPLYEDDGAPLSPARASLHLSGALPDRAMAVADAGEAGFWVARTFPTSIPNSVCVPATAAPGFAAAAALCCVLDDRPVLAVTDEAGIDSQETGAVLALAEQMGTAVAIQVWRRGGPAWTGAGQHVELIEAELAADGVRVDEVPVRFEDMTLLEEVAGPVSAWPSEG
jgi:thiamine pyrophosphate-dependent acetolactate synthase large subunit-like protein